MMSSSLISDARARVLSTLDLLLLIFEQLTPNDSVEHFSTRRQSESRCLAAAALVSQSWFTAAIRLLWHTSTGNDLLRLIPGWREFEDEHNPNVERERSMVSYHRPLRVYEWQRWADSLRPEDYCRFMVYAQYVVRLRRGGRYSGLILQAFVNGPSSPFRSTLSPFPKLTELEWLVSFPGYTHGLGEIAKCEAPGFVPLIQIHAHQIRSLILGDDHYLRSIESLLPSMLQQMPYLENIQLPQTLSPVLSDCFEVLSRCRYLSSISAPDSCVGRGGDNDLSASFNPSLPEGAFPALGFLELCGNISDIARFFEMEHAPRTLDKLVIYYGTPWTSTPEDIERAFQTIATKCKSLQYFKCDLSPRGNSVDRMRGLAQDTISFEVLRPLAALTRMEKFFFKTRSSFNIGDADMAQLVQDWGRLKEMELHCRPATASLLEEQTMTLCTLSFLFLAMYCPFVERLSLPMSLDAPEPETASLHYTSTPLLKVLQSLTIFPGLSWTRSEEIFETASFLSDLCPNNCDISCKLPEFGRG
ncbi:unnamed protein product [Somion occarium]|uniref:F-box domain-containing protein n=1 Tax=Somion occarium TaxID=3059160 RepID=A0ABP1D4T8_9APHY